MELHTYFRSSAAYRVRIALNLKGIAYTPRFVQLPRGEHRSAAYAALNPQALVPTLVDGGAALTQSLAILEYLEETHPQPALLPADAAGRARVRSLALFVACEIHPLNNLRVLQHLRGALGRGEDEVNAWYRHWIADGLARLEADLVRGPGTGRFCHGDAPGYADCCLVPQLFNARRYDCDLSPYPVCVRIDAACNALDAFVRAQPAHQPDAA